MRILMIILLCSAFAMGGCIHLQSGDHYCQVRMANRSEQPIRFVTLDPDGKSTDFGFFDVGGGHATAAACNVPLVQVLTIQWKEGDSIKRATLDLSPYASKASSIKSLSFSYLGQGNWEVVAHAGDQPNSTIIRP